MKQQENNQSVLTSLRGLIPHRRLQAAEAFQIAERQATQLRAMLDIDTPAFPHEVISELPRIKVLQDADLPTSGMTFWDGNNWNVLLKSTEHETRQRFSLLHEYHHIVAHNNTRRLYGTENFEANPQAEKIADYFAACVLMPKMLVKRHFGQGPRNATDLAELFQVSPKAMSYRLDQLGLTEPASRYEALLRVKGQLANARRYHRAPSHLRKIAA